MESTTNLSNVKISDIDLSESLMRAFDAQAGLSLPQVDALSPKDHERIESTSAGKANE